VFLVDKVDEFIDDDEFMEMPASARHTVETSHHFSRAERSQVPYQQRDTMADCDEFERLATDECYEKLIRLRNDVVPFSKVLTDRQIANREKVRSNATIFTDTALREIAIRRPRGGSLIPSF
jgi:hypothetical protein